jgi:hypothetical protein
MPTVIPPAGAGAAREIVQSSVPGLFGSGLHVIDVEPLAEASKSMEAVRDVPLHDAVTTAVCPLDTVPALAVKLATLEPAATVTDDGTLSDGELLDTTTAAPPELAGPERLTVQVAVPPDVRLFGVQERRLTDPAATSEISACALPFRTAVITAV